MSLSTSHFIPCVLSLLSSKVWVPSLPRPSLFLILVLELVGLYRNQARSQDTSLCREFLDDARLALHDCRESKREVVTESVGDQQPLPWDLSGLCGFGRTDHLDCGITVFDEKQQKLDLHQLRILTSVERAPRVRISPPRRGGCLVA